MNFAQMLTMVQGENESLRQQLAAALAAIKVKDGVLDEAAQVLSEEGIWSTATICKKASAIKPDDDALKPE